MDTLTSITEIISIITVAQLLLFGIFLFTARKNTSKDKIILAFFLIANSFFILNFLFFNYRQAVLTFNINLFYLGGTAGFLFGPLLFLYAKAVTSKEYRFSATDIFHFILFLIVFVLTLVRFQFQSYETKIEILASGLYVRPLSILYHLAMHLTILIYLLMTFFIVKQKNQNLKIYYSSLDEVNYNWLKLVVSAFIIMWIIDIVNWISVLFGIGSNAASNIFTFFSLSINFAFANLLILKSLSLPEIAESETIHKYEKSPLTIQTKNDILSRLEKLMIGEKLFLNSSLNLGEVAQKLSVVPRYLSQVINEIKGQNFYDFVNYYRIEEAKKMLTDPTHIDDKILSVLYDCGFNSKSVFNTVFKKNTGVTPSEYRKRYKQSA